MHQYWIPGEPGYCHSSGMSMFCSDAFVRTCIIGNTEQYFCLLFDCLGMLNSRAGPMKLTRGQFVIAYW